MSLEKTAREWLVNPDGTRGYEWNFPEEGNPRSGRLSTANLLEPERLEKPSRILVKGDLFSGRSGDARTGQLLFTVRKMKRHDFAAVTDASREMFRWRELIPGKNLWLGVRYTGKKDMIKIFYLRMLDPGIRFVVFANVEDEVNMSLRYLDWIVLDPGPRKKMIQAFARRLVVKAKTWGIPVFTTSRLQWENPLKEFPSRTKGGQNGTKI